MYTFKTHFSNTVGVSKEIKLGDRSYYGLNLKHLNLKVYPILIYLVLYFFLQSMLFLQYFSPHLISAFNIRNVIIRRQGKRKLLCKTKC